MRLLPAQRELRKYASPARARVFLRFFKTGPGEYGEGDRFIGVTVPATRRVAKRFAETGYADLKRLLSSPVHEDRLLALLILVERSVRIRARRNPRPGGARELERIAAFYLRHRAGVNNWDLVDLSVRTILGEEAVRRGDNSALERLSRSKRHWDRRMAMIGTFAHLRAGRLDLTFRFSERFLTETEDLMHKATGWMLREAGKRDPERLRAFIRKHGRKMPRTMLRYAIEKFPPADRRRILGETRSGG